MEDADDSGGGSAVGGDDEGGDFVALHEGEGFGGEGCGGDGVGDGIEDFDGGEVEGVGAGVLEEAAEVAVGEDAEELGVRLSGGLDGGEAEALGGHLVDDLGHGGVGRDGGDGVGGVHELLDGG